MHGCCHLVLLHQEALGWPPAPWRGDGGRCCPAGFVLLPARGCAQGFGRGAWGGHTLAPSLPHACWSRGLKPCELQPETSRSLWRNSFPIRSLQSAHRALQDKLSRGRRGSGTRCSSCPCSGGAMVRAARQRLSSGLRGLFPAGTSPCSHRQRVPAGIRLGNKEVGQGSACPRALVALGTHRPAELHPTTSGRGCAGRGRPPLPQTGVPPSHPSPANPLPSPLSPQVSPAAPASRRRS